MNPDLAKESRFVRRFRREAKAASVLKNPNTVQILEFGVDQGYVFLAMELLRGFDLAMLLHKEKRVNEGRALRIVAQVCRALSFAHKQSIVHRDLKPDNIMLVKIPDGVKPPVPGCLPQDFVKVLDFGIAKILDDDGDKPAVDSRAEPVTQEKSMLTRVGTIVGTPAYMAPEQGRAEPVDGRTDLYACGVLLYELITGRVPFVGETPMQVVMRHVNEPPRPPSEFGKVHPEVEKVIMRALAKFAAGRQQSAEEMEAEILGVLAKVDPVSEAAGVPRAAEVEGANKTLVIEPSLPEVGGGIDPAGLGFPTLNIEVPDDLLPPNLGKDGSPEQPATRRAETPIRAPRAAAAAIPVVNAAAQKAGSAPLAQTMQSLATETTTLTAPRPADLAADDDEEPATMVKAPPQVEPHRRSLAEEAMARMLKGGPDVPSVAGPESVEPTLVAAQTPEKPRAARPPAPPAAPAPKPNPHETTTISEQSPPAAKPPPPPRVESDEKRQLGLAETVRLDPEDIDAAQQARISEVGQEKKDAPIRRPTSELVPVVLDEDAPPDAAPKAEEPSKEVSPAAAAAAVWTPEPKKKLGGGAALFLGIAIGAVLVAVGLGVVMLLR
jgi:serine/threonine-protein kinase